MTYHSDKYIVRPLLHLEAYHLQGISTFQVSYTHVSFNLDNLFVTLTSCSSGRLTIWITDD